MRALCLALVVGLAPAAGVAQSEPTPATSPGATPAQPPLPPQAERTEDGVTVHASVEPFLATVGDVLTLSVRVEAAKGDAVAEPQVAGKLAPFDLVEPFALVSEREQDGRVTREFRARLSLFEVGARPLPSIEVGVRGVAGERRIAVPAVGVQVDSVLPAEAKPELKDAKAVLHTRGPIPPWVFALLGLLAGLGLGLFFWRRRRVLLPPGPKEPPIPCDERALKELRELVDSPLLPSGRIKEFYVRFSEIVRTYLGARFEFDAMELTSDELNRALREKRVPETARDLVRTIAGSWDFVKFARYRPGDDEHRSAIAHGFRLVEDTRQRAEPAPQAAPAGGRP